MSATVLAIDTSGDDASLVLLEAGGRITESIMHSSDGHSSRLFGELQALLLRAGKRLGDVDVFAAAAGPGSFTGVRVALSAAKGFAVAFGKPMAAVSNLQALAWFSDAPLRAVVADARRGDSFVAVYDTALRLVQPETVTARLHEWLAALPSEGLEIVTAHPAHLAGRVLSHPIRSVAPERLGRAVAYLARPVDPALTDANYVRHSDAERRWTDRAQAAGKVSIP